MEIEQLIWEIKNMDNWIPDWTDPLVWSEIHIKSEVSLKSSR